MWFRNILSVLWTVLWDSTGQGNGQIRVRVRAGKGQVGFEDVDTASHGSSRLLFCYSEPVVHTRFYNEQSCSAMSAGDDDLQSQCHECLEECLDKKDDILLDSYAIMTSSHKGDRLYTCGQAAISPTHAHM